MPWPTVLHKYVGNENDDVWSAVIERAKSHPEEVGIQGAGYGQTALHAACYRYPPEAAIRVLIDACPKAASAQNSDGETALHLALDGASEKVQTMLLEACPAAVSMVDKYGDSPLHLAAQSGASTELLRKMLESSPKTAKVANKRGATPFFLIPRTYEYIQNRKDIEKDGEYEDDWARVSMFLKATYFGSLDVPKGRQFYCLHAAASIKCPQILLQTIARLFPEQAVQTDENGLTPLAIAASAPIYQEPEVESTDFFDISNHSDVAVRFDALNPEQLNHENDPNNSLEGESGVSPRNQYHRHGSELRPLSEQQNDSTAYNNIYPRYDNASFVNSKPPQKLTVIQILINLNPRAALIADSEGRLPFVRAVESEKSWDEGLRSLLWAAPQALSTRDLKTGMYPFMIAAMDHNASETTVYELIRLLPELVAIGIPLTTGTETSLDDSKKNQNLYKCDKKKLQTASSSQKRKYEHDSAHQLSDKKKKSTPCHSPNILKMIEG